LIQAECGLHTSKHCFFNIAAEQGADLLLTVKTTSAALPTDPSPVPRPPAFPCLKSAMSRPAIAARCAGSSEGPNAHRHHPLSAGRVPLIHRAACEQWVGERGKPFHHVLTLFIPPCAPCPKAMAANLSAAALGQSKTQGGTGPSDTQLGEGRSTATPSATVFRCWLWLRTLASTCCAATFRSIRAGLNGRGAE